MIATVQQIIKSFLLGAVILLFIGATEFPAFCSSTFSDTTIGVGIRLSTLGPGLEAALPVTERTNIRVGYSALDYHNSSDKSGVTYDGHLQLRAFEGHFDWFPFGGWFHISPGFRSTAVNR